MHQMVIKMLWQVINGESISCVFFPFTKAYEVRDAESFPQY